MDHHYEAAHRTNRPVFPKKAVVTAGMPYGNKELHLGHVGGVFVHADTYARFLRDRIGADNVLFVSGTDCYGSPILEHYRQLSAEGAFKGSIQDFVLENHQKQKAVLDAYHISINLFAASSIGRAAEVHAAQSDGFIRTLYENGHLIKLTTSQFYDPEREVFLNGRQVVGRCPIAGCASEKGYADECALGHQYMPADLIAPVSTLSGKRPTMRDVTNWYFKLDAFHERLTQWVAEFQDRPTSRHFAVRSIGEFLAPPVIYVKRDQIEETLALKDQLPAYEIRDEENKSSFTMVFEKLAHRESACARLAAAGIRFRTGKTLVPFRLTGNIEWGVPAPALEELEGLTVWVWPESLWAPISFTKTYLESQGQEPTAWKDWWCTHEAKVYQFIGEDNVYFYGPVEMAMFMGTQGPDPQAVPTEGDLLLPDLIVNNHLLFLDKKASSSGKVKPPTARELLDHYTPEQLRAHFLGLGLGIRSVSFQPKPFNPQAGEKDSDPVLKEGSLLTNVLNRAVRSCFYTTQKYYDGVLPYGKIEADTLQEAEETILEYERLMHRCELHQIMNLMDTFIRNINKYFSSSIREAEAKNNDSLRRQILINTFHLVRTAAVLMHPIAPEGTEMIQEYLRLPKEMFHWDRIFEPVYAFMEDPQQHLLKFLEPRVDFFSKHPSQLNG